MSTISKHRLLPYGRQFIGDEEVEAVVSALRSDWLTQGPLVDGFERALAVYCGARHAVAVSSGTAALHLAAQAAGVGPGSRAITTPNTFVATANGIRHAGGEPRFVDVDPRTLNLDPVLLERYLQQHAETEDLRAILPVHFAGYPADMERIWRLAARRGLAVIEDACHALGGLWRDSAGCWQRVGSCSHSDMTVFSFHPVKQITTAEGGAILTNRDDLAERLRELRHHGIVRDPARLAKSDGPWYYEMQSLGFNYRLSELHCALGLVQLGRLDRWIERRRQLVARYREMLGSLPDVRWIEETDAVRPAWHLFVVQVPRRDAVYRRMREMGIGVQVHYLPVHLHPYYRDLLGCADGDFPQTEAYYRQALSLPLYPQIENPEVDRVVDCLRVALEESEVRAGQ